MKKSFTIAKLAAVFLLGGAAMTANAAITLEAMPTDGSSFTVGIVNGNGTLYYFDAPSDGTLTITCEAGGNPDFLYTGWNVDEPVGGTISGTGSLETGLAFSVEQGTKYYAYEYAFSVYGQRTMTASFQAAAGGGTDTPVDFPIEVAEWNMDQTYSGFSWKTEGDVSGPSNLLTFTPSSNGTLVVIQKGSDANNTHIYSKEWNKKSSFSTYTNMVMTADGYYETVSSGTYKLTYNVVQDVTYYYYAKSEQYDLITEMSATFTSTGQAEKNVAKVGEAFDCYNKTWEFTPEVTGVMSVVINPYSFPIASPNEGSNLVYTDPAHLNKVSSNGMGQDIDGGYEMQYNVKAGQTYYFYQDAAASVQVTITQVAEQELSVSLVNTDPTPGDSSWNIDPYSYASGFRYYFSPASSAVTIESATIKYNDQNNNVQTVTLSGNDLEFQGGGFSLKIYETLLVMKQNGKKGEMFYVTLNGVKLDGETVPVTTSIQSDYVEPGQGTITIGYYMAPEFKVVNQTWPTTIYETWTQGDANGIATIVFTNVVKNVGSATVTLGNKTWGSTGGESSDPTANIPYTILDGGTTLQLDFSSIKAEDWDNPDNLSFSGYSTCTVFLTGVEDEYGQYYGDTPSFDVKIPFSATVAENPVIAMEAGQIISPDGNNYAANIDYFMVQWADQILTQVTGQKLEAELFIGETSMGNVPVEICPLNENSEVNDCLKIDLTSFEGQYGTYNAIIPLGIVENEEGNVNPLTTITCIILPLNEDYIISPSNGEVEQGGVIEVSFEGGTILTINDKAPSIEWANNAARWRLNEAGSAIAIDVYEDMELGEYNLSIPATVVIIDGQSLNGPVEETFLVIESKSSAINGLDADANGLYNVYSVNGAKVATGNADVVKNLNKGLYIINGKKVLVK